MSFMKNCIFLSLVLSSCMAMPSWFGTEKSKKEINLASMNVGYKDGTFDEIEVPKNLGEIMAKHKAKKKPAKKQMPHKEEERMEEKVHPGIHKKIDEIEKKKGK